VLIGARHITGVLSAASHHQRRIELDRGRSLSPAFKGRNNLRQNTQNPCCSLAESPSQVSRVVARVHASQRLPPGLKEARTVEACGGGAVSRWKEASGRGPPGLAGARASRGVRRGRRSGDFRDRPGGRYLKYRPPLGSYRPSDATCVVEIASVAGASSSLRAADGGHGELPPSSAGEATFSADCVGAPRRPAASAAGGSPSLSPPGGLPSQKLGRCA